MNLYFYTVAKAASDFVAHKIIKPLTETLQLQHHDFEHLAFQAGCNLNKLIAEHRAIIESDNNYFGALRHGALHDHHYGPQDKVIIHVRDPRDCLTSLYYSIVFSHPVPEGAGREAFIDFRRQVAERTVDEQCLRQVRSYAPMFSSYVELAESTENVLVSRYEDMVSDFEVWLTRLFDFLDVPTTNPLYRDMLEATNFTVEREDVTRHMRRVVPGDFMHKLHTETIEELNQAFALPLRHFGYPLVPPEYKLWKRRA